MGLRINVDMNHKWTKLFSAATQKAMGSYQVKVPGILWVILGIDPYAQGDI